MPSTWQKHKDSTICKRDLKTHYEDVNCKDWDGKEAEYCPRASLPWWGVNPDESGNQFSALLKIIFPLPEAINQHRIHSGERMGRSDDSFLFTEAVRMAAEQMSNKGPYFEEECEQNTDTTVATSAEKTWEFGDDVFKLANLEIGKVAPRLLKPVSCIFSKQSAQIVILVLNSAIDLDTGHPPSEVI